MATKMKQTPATSTNPALSVDKNGCVYYSNEAGDFLLNEWGARIGEKLPSNVVDLVQKVISRNSPKKIEVKAGNKVYLIIFHPLPESESVNISGFDISEQNEIEEYLLEAHEHIKTQFEELSASNRDLRVQSDEINEANTLLNDSITGFRTLAENSPDLITRFDRQDRCIYANPAAKLFNISLIAELHGWSVHEFNDKTDSKVEIYPEMMKLSEKLRKNAFTTGKSEALIFRYTSPKGKKYWFDTKVIPEFANNEVVSVIVISSDITYLKEAEAILRSSNLYNRSLIEASLDPLIIIGNDSNVTDVNRATEQATGYSRNDLIGSYFAQYLTEPDHAISAFIHVCTHGELRDCALEIIHKDGHITPVLCNASVYRDENGKVTGVFVAARDITELKKAEKALKETHNSLEERVKERTEELEKAYISLKESEMSLAEAQRMAHIGNWVWDIETDKAYWSEEMYRIFKRDSQKLAPSLKEYLNYIHPDDLDYYCKETYMTKKESTNGFDFRIILADREERTLHIKSEFIFNDENIPVRVKGTVQDITDRKRSEEKLRESEEKYRNIVETANEGILIINNDNIITFVNKKISDMLGYTVEESISKPVWGFISDECKVDVESHLEKRRRGISESYELKLICKDGSSVWTFLNVKPFFDNAGKYIGAMSMFTDITKRKEAEETLKNMEIARKQEIHHRIKNNLQVISSLLDLQAEKFNGKKNIKDSDIMEAFRESQDRVISMALIHEELHKGGQTDTLDVSHYIEDLADNLLLTYRVGDTGIILETDIEEDIFFDMDTSVPLGIITNELISNSLKHAFPERDYGVIQIKLHRKSGDCKIEGKMSTNYVLSISDNGAGISDDLDIENLDSLGLQLVTTLVEQLDGDLELKRNNGTEFIIRFSVTENKIQY